MDANAAGEAIPAAAGSNPTSSSSSSSSSSGVQRSVLLKQDSDDIDDEDEDEDIPLPVVQQGAVPEKSKEIAQSEECSEALQAIESDAWDANSWILFIQEVEDGRGGPTLTVVDAYNRFLERFPRASKYWKALGEYYIKKQDYAAAEEMYNKCVSKCRNVDLWLSYIHMVRMKVTGGTGAMSADLKPVEVAFEKAVENVGMSIDSAALWKAYVEFIRDRRDWLETGDGRKLAAFRKIYQKALCVSHDALDSMWREYEALEKMAGEHLAEKVLPEFEGKFSHAKAIYRDRRRACAKIDFDRMAVPPSNSVVELQQLGLWNKWIRYEMTNPDNLSKEPHHALMRLVYEQCLCCLLHHPEVWMSYARLQLDAGGATDARTVYRQAIEVVPDVVALRVALAELEEAQGNQDAAKGILKGAFDKLPCAFTFATYQRFVRRKEGISAARKVFSETLTLRRDLSNEALGLELCMAHAQLELEVNCSAEVALKTLDLAQLTCPSALNDMRYLRLAIHVLSLRGDLRQVRWLFQTALGDAASQLAGGGSGIVVEAINRSNFLSIVAANLITSGLQDVNTGSRKGPFGAPGSLAERSLKDQMELWEEYLRVETLLGQSDVVRLDELRKARDKARAAYEEGERTRQAASTGAVGADYTSEMALSKIRGLFDSAFEFGERYEQLGSMFMPAADASLRKRSRTRGGLEDSHVRPEGERERGQGGGRQRRSQRHDDEHVSQFAGVPTLLRDFVPRLPLHVGNLPDIDGFVRQLRVAVLPPRPADLSPVPEADVVIPPPPTVGVKRAAEGPAGEEEDDEEGEGEGQRDDIFRQRARARLEAKKQK